VVSYLIEEVLPVFRTMSFGQLHHIPLQELMTHRSRRSAGLRFYGHVIGYNAGDEER